MEYGFELHEFDPYFNYRATEFILENGISEYFDWHDAQSWYPNGRDVSATSQSMLHLTAYATYLTFGMGSSLYDFTVMLPVVLGSLTTVIIFALVRVLAGTTAGLFASIFFSVSLPILLRGSLGWFKSEPLGLFYGLLAVYLFLSGIRTVDKKIAMLKLAGGGVIFGFGLASWGGVQFFVIPLGIFLFVLPFLRRADGFLIWAIPVFVSAFLLTVALFERPGLDFVFGLGGFAIIIPTVFFVSCGIVQERSRQEHAARNCLVLLLIVMLLGSSLLVLNEDHGFIQMPSFRYLNALNPFFTATNTLTNSVSEHTSTNIQNSFFFHSVLMIFAALGVWLMFSKKTGDQNMLKNDMLAFALIIGMSGAYVSSAFIRLEVFASISVIVLSSIGLSMLLKAVFHNSYLGSTKHAMRNRAVKGSLFTIVIFLLLVPFLMPGNANWMSLASSPPTILNGGTMYPVGTDDWKESLDWIKNNTSEDSVVAAWWDYGYWISTLSERTTLVDNATIDSHQIERMAGAFLSTPDDGWAELQAMGADYVVVFVAGERLSIAGEPLYILRGGGDESKKPWFVRLAGEPLPKYLYPDNHNPTDYFWNETLLGYLFPFSTLGYVNFESNIQSPFYVFGLDAVYLKDVKYPKDDADNPFRLVYASPGYTEEELGPMLGVFVYEINDDYVPGNESR